MTALNDYRLLPCLLAWEKVPDRADEGPLAQPIQRLRNPSQRFLQIRFTRRK